MKPNLLYNGKVMVKFFSVDIEMHHVLVKTSIISINLT